MILNYVCKKTSLFLLHHYGLWVNLNKVEFRLGEGSTGIQFLSEAEFLFIKIPAGRAVVEPEFKSE